MKIITKLQNQIIVIVLVQMLWNFENWLPHASSHI